MCKMKKEKLIFGFLFGLVLLVGIGSVSAAQDWYVENTNPSCDNAGPGTLAQPLCNISAADTRHAGGDTVYILPGDYREHIFPKDGIGPGQYTVYSGYGAREDVRIIGSDEVTGWSLYAGNIYQASFTAPTKCSSGFQANCWEDRARWFYPVSTLAGIVQPGQFYYDGSSVYVWPWDNQPANTHQIECSVRHTVPWGDYDGFWPNVPKNYITVKNLTIMQSHDRGISLSSSAGNMDFINNIVTFSTGCGTAGSNPSAFYHGKCGVYEACYRSNINIIGNIISEAGSDKGPGIDAPGSSDHAGAAIKFYQVDNSIIANNTMYNVAQGVALKGGNARITIQDNVIYNTGDYAMYFMLYNDDHVIERNLLYNVGNKAVGFNGKADNNTFRHNTFIAPGGIKVRTEYGGDFTNPHIYNNLFSSDTSTQIDVVGTFGRNAYMSDSDYNFFNDTSGSSGFKWQSTTILDLAGWQTNSGNDWNSSVGDPLFNNPSVNDYTLQAGSSAIDAGTWIPGYHCALADDNGGSGLTGCSHWSGLAPDIGAFEYSPPTVTRFAIIGDFGIDSPEEADVAALVKSWNPEFIINTGDNNYPNGQGSTIDANVGKHYQEFIWNYTGAYGPGSVTNRFFPSLGNHDWIFGCTSGLSCIQPYTDYFTLPGNERYYNFSWGVIDFFVIDSEDAEPDAVKTTTIQQDWLQSKLAASTAKLKIVYMHHPPFTSSDSGPNNSEVDWPYQQWGADVVIGGHDHTYERIIKNGFPYFVNGAGGAALKQFWPPYTSGSVVRYNSDWGAQLVEVNDTHATFTFITRGNVIIDSYTITLSQPPATCHDVNSDGKVNIFDVALVLANQGKSGSEYSHLDVDVSGVVDFADANLVIGDFGEVC